jgi:hypothetical protein
MRVQDRVGPNGEKILHVEEIQSDWHQAGRKQGYKLSPEETAPMDSEYRALVHKNSDARAAGLEPDPKDVERAKQLEDALVKADSSKIPDAPFKKNWHELAMKRLINHASENGYDKIAITPGAEQASRYDLSKRISEIKYDPETKNFLAKDINGGIVKRGYVPPEELPNYVGKEMAEKVAAGGNFTGLDLQTGGEGMKGFYDKMLPDYLNTLGKKYGTQVGSMDFDFGGYKVNRDSGELPYRLETEGSPDILSRFATADEAWREAEKRGSKPLHTFDITPQLREEVTTKGLPLYQQIGLPIGAGTAASELELPEYAEGGQVFYQPIPTPSNAEIMSTAGGSTNNLTPSDNLYLQSQEDIAKLDPRMQREFIANMGGKELRERMLGKYADGGAVNYNTQPDMNDGGVIIQGAPYKRGGKVRMTDNLDEMFMEVNNKKFQRK